MTNSTLKKQLPLLFFALLLSIGLKSQDVVINEVMLDGTVELKNQSTSVVDVSNYYLCHFPDYSQLSSLTIECGSLMMMPGQITTVSGIDPMNSSDGELGLYTTNTFATPSAMVDYLEWGYSGHMRSFTATQAGMWSTGDFIQTFTEVQSLEYSGTGNSSASWVVQDNPSICAENGTGTGCTAEGGTITGGPYEFCIDDIADFATDVMLTGNSGMNSQWVVTDAMGIILGLPDLPSDVDFNAAGVGTCLIWHLSYEDGLTGLAMGNNTNSDLEGCFDLSNSITVVRMECVDCTVDGGSVGSQTFTFCVDGLPDHVEGISVINNIGDSSQWMVTDEAGVILGLPGAPEDVDFDAAGTGTCLIWHLSYTDTIAGLTMGNNAMTDLTGCYDISEDFVTVIRVDSMPPCVTALSESEILSAVKVYPNPVSNEVTVSNESDEVLVVTLMDISGRIVIQPESVQMYEQEIIDMVGLEQGTYLLRMKGEGATVVKSLIKK